MHIVPLYRNQDLRIVPEACFGLRPAWTLQRRTRLLGIPTGWAHVQSDRSLQALLDLVDHLTLKNAITEPRS